MNMAPGRCKDPLQSLRWPLWFVVRRPELAFSTEPRVRLPLKAVGRLVYHGLDRLAWWDVDELDGSGQLPARLVPVLRSVHGIESAADLAGADTAEEAVRLLHATSEIAARNEVVCALGHHSVGERAPAGVDWHGYDPIYKSGGPFTLLGQVFLHRDGPMAGRIADLNQYGLFDAAAAAEEFGRQYAALALEDRVEPLPLFDLAFEVLAVGRLRGRAEDRPNAERTIAPCLPQAEVSAGRVSTGSRMERGARCRK
jgi:hypothetical protein